jgi:hypothetical protein
LAAEQGDAGAQNYLGWAYANGDVVAQDHGESVKWYRLSAAQGNAHAQVGLGMAYFKGEGVAQDHEESGKWFSLAEAQGNTWAQYNLRLVKSVKSDGAEISAPEASDYDPALITDRLRRYGAPYPKRFLENQSRDGTVAQPGQETLSSLEGNKQLLDKVLDRTLAPYRNLILGARADASGESSSANLPLTEEEKRRLDLLSGAGKISTVELFIAFKRRQSLLTRLRHRAVPGLVFKEPLWVRGTVTP